jgi:uncharacterized protein (DUF488 family)
MRTGRARIFTVGHGNRTVDDLIAILRSAGVERVVDVRAHPGSRRNPQFGKDALAASLALAAIAYEWRGDGLGGRRHSTGPSRHPAWREPAFRAYADYMDTPAFRSALAKLEAGAASGPVTAILCAETLWWQCHRRLIADALTVDGVLVTHLFGPGKQEEHRLHPNLRVDEEGRPVYDRDTNVGLFG